MLFLIFLLALTMVAPTVGLYVATLALLYRALVAVFRLGRPK